MHPSASRMLKRSFVQMASPAIARAATAAAASTSTSTAAGARHSTRALVVRTAAAAGGNYRFSTAAMHHHHHEQQQHEQHEQHERRDREAPSPAAKFKYAIRSQDSSAPIWDNPIPHAVYDLDAIAHIEKTHHEPAKLHEKAALLAVKALRTGFDVLSGYRGPGGGMTERDWLNRCLFLETVAGVPGMVAGMARHLRSLRSLQRDYGWIHTLLEEAENERMHLLIFMNMKQPGWLFRAMVLGAQGVFFNAFFLTYLASPRTCHRFVGYLEEEAVKTYTALLQDIEDGHVDAWKNSPAPLIARNYYKLPDSAQVVDMIKCIRADEANHRDVNHTFAGLDQRKDVNPFIHGH